MDPLRTCLIDLLYELRDESMPLTIGGGLGLFLKKLHLVDRGTPTLFTELPAARATNDIDMYLRVDVLSDTARTEALVAAIRRLGYTPVDEAKYLQWKRPIQVGGVTQEVKLDALVGPLGSSRDKIHVNPPRVRPKGKSVGFHAHQTDEALFIEDAPLPLQIAGNRSNGDAFAATVYVPEAFPYLMMKLSAFADRKNDSNKDLGRHHALDTYAIVGMMTEAEYERALALGERSRSESHYRHVCEVVAEEFGTANALGVLRMREHRLFQPNFRIDTFVATLEEIFRR